MDLKRYEIKRKRLYQDLSQVGDFRRGSISTNYRRCGKPNCACAEPDHPGHGPQYLLTKKVDGKSRAKNLRQGPELQKVEEELANHQKFRDIIKDIIDINENICDIKDTELRADTEAIKKGASKTSSKPKSSQN